MKKQIFRLDIDGNKMIWHFGIIDVPYIKQFGTISQVKGKEEGLQLKATNLFKTFYNVFVAKLIYYLKRDV